MTTKLDSTGASAGAVCLQDAVQHPGKAVEQDLGGEYGQHLCADPDQVGLDAARLPGRDQHRHDRSRGDRQDRADRDENGDCPGQHRGADLADLPGGRRVGTGALSGPGQHRHHDAGQRTAENDVVDDVRHLVGSRVGRAEAGVPDGVRENDLAAESCHPGEDREPADQRGRAADSPRRPRHAFRLADLGGRADHGVAAAAGVAGPAGPGCASDPALASGPASGSGPACASGSGPGPASAPRPAGPVADTAAGRRPSMSSQRSGGVRSITLVKLTTSLAAVSPRTPASAATRADRGSVAAAAVPSSAPRAFAPASPSMACSPRSSGSSAMAAPAGAAAAQRAAARCAGPAPGPAASMAAAAIVTLMARPGRRSNRLSRFALPAVRTELMTMSAAEPPSSALAATPLVPIPPILSAPLVSSP